MELRAEDLRCNNILLVDDGKGEPYQITIKGINTINGGHVYDEDDSIHGLDCLKPISLTEVWLLKFGWGKTEYDDEYADNVSLEKAVLLYNCGCNILSIELDSEALEIRDIKYVHQLQNLIKELTNKELQVL